jgi:hypothetical protein
MAIKKITDLTIQDNIDGDDQILGIDDSQGNTKLKTVLFKISDIFKKTVAKLWEGIELSDGRPFAQELLSTIPANGTGTYTIAELSTDGTFRGGSAFFTVWFQESWMTFMVHCDDASSIASSRQTIKILDNSNPAGIPSLDYVELLTSTTQGSGAKINLHITQTSTSRTLYTTMYNASGWGAKVWSLVPATTTDNDKTPGGQTGVAIEAGTELKSISSASTHIDGRIKCVAASTAALRVTIYMDEIPKQDLTTVTFPVGFSFRRSDGTVIYTVSNGENMSATTRGNVVEGTITTSGLTTWENGTAVGVNISADFT